MENNASFTELTVRTAVQDFAGLILGALVTGTAVAGVAMGLVLLLAQ